MPNATGKNGYGKKKYPPPDVLRASLMEYFKLRLTAAEKLARLWHDHKLDIKRSKLHQLEKEHKIPAVKGSRSIPEEIARQHVVDVAAADLRQGMGPRAVITVLRGRGIPVPRDAARLVMKEAFPEGPVLRYPGRQKPKIPRKALEAIGPWHQVCGDGHEKLGAQALNMGGVGLPIYGYRDMWTGNMLSLATLPNSRSPGALGHFLLDLIEHHGVIALQLNLDRGSETGWQYSIQVNLRELCAPDVDPEVYPPFMYMPSTNNTPIESFWRWLKEKIGLNLKDHILRGKELHIFNATAIYHVELFNWIFPPLLQGELDEFREYWNNHHIRPQVDKINPSGHAPAQLMAIPHMYGGKYCGAPVPTDVLQQMREVLVEDVGPVEEHLRWVSPEFAELAQTAYEAIDSPPLTFSTSWDVFQAMIPVLQQMYEDSA